MVGTPTLTNTNDTFNVCIRLLLGFCEDFKKCLVSTRQELILLRLNTDYNAVITSKADGKPQIILNKIFSYSLPDAQKLFFYSRKKWNRFTDCPLLLGAP